MSDEPLIRLIARQALRIAELEDTVTTMKDLQLQIGRQGEWLREIGELVNYRGHHGNVAGVVRDKLTELTKQDD